MNSSVNGQFREDEVVVLQSNINGQWVENRHVKVGGKLRVLHQENECMSSAEVGILGGRISGEFQPQIMVLGCFGLSPYAA